ncbi:IS21 family transposase [Clostridium sp. 19966]|uniref:IS21 family transposase n=1 Tax=Clostridium sp. 19966 TaxID=2768166 RepID=UPI0028E4D001|nr:IS21 family transposase [Clostridium sp. 19966]
MKGWNLFGEIKQHKSMGLNKSQVQRLLSINYKTVDKYWDMTPDEYAKLVKEAKSRTKKIDKYKDEILEWITDFRDISSAQVYDWLREKNGDLDFKERSLRHYISHLREVNKLPKIATARQYEAVDELLMGYQAQVDMGQIWLTNTMGSRTRVYCFAMVLSHSRYKYILWSVRPFTTETFIDAHNKAFEYFGGMPLEIVYDQDRILTVSENNGDIIYTEGFQNYIDLMKYKVRLCRAFDPESKGKIEAVVKFAKYNFAHHRIFVDIDSFNDDSLQWLIRTGNGKVHETTKKIPAEVFSFEQEHLKPVPHLFKKYSSDNSLIYSVRKDNIILYKQVRYQVPKGTYMPGKEVKLLINDMHMNIIDIDTNEVIASHKISLKKGDLVKIIHPERDLNSTADAVYERAFIVLGQTENAKALLDNIRKEKVRYCKDQFGVIINASSAYDSDIVSEAVNYCVNMKLWSAGTFKDTLEYFSNKKLSTVDKIDINSKVQIPSKYSGVKPQVRDIREYSAALRKEKNKWRN